MYTVVLDSTALISSGPRSGPLKDLAKCAKVSEVKVHVPELVIREAATNIASKAASAKADGLLHVAHWSDDDAIQAAAETIRKLKAERKDTEYHVHNAIEAWVESVGGVIKKLDEMRIGGVFDDYFEGAGAFTDAPKERARIPDALLYAYVVDLAETARFSHDEEEVLIVTADKALTENLRGIEGVRVFASVGDLVTQSGIREWMEVGDLRIHHDFVKMFFEDLAMRVSLPGEDVYLDVRPGPSVTVKLENGTVDEEGVVYFPFKVVFKSVVAVAEKEPGGDLDEVSVGPVIVTGTARGEIRTDPDGDKFVVNLSPTTTKTVLEPSPSR